MKINNIGFVGIPVTDVRRARQFYEAVFGLNVAQKMSGKWVEYAIGNQPSLSQTQASNGRHQIKEQLLRWRWKTLMK